MRKTQATILIIDDQEEILIAGKLLLKRLFEVVLTCSNPKQIPELLQQNEIDVIIMDMNFRTGYENGKEGIFWLKEIHQLQPNVKVILMTSYGSIETAVEGLKLGAIDYVLKPWDNEKLIQQIKDTVKQKRKTKSLVTENQVFLGNAPAIQKVYKLTERIAATNATLLILGENGTGKSLLAKTIHEQSNRSKEPFIQVDLGALNVNLFESELFGYAKGAFTDAKEDTMGRFENANGGTLFLDEIGNVPLHLQAKLLQVIQNKEITRVGESKPRKVDVRIITATNTNLEEAVANGTFREDLLYRINTIAVKMPALKQRKEDIIPMIQFFLVQAATTYDLEVPSISEALLQQLEQYAWNGNIRELQNRMERAVILAENNEITLENLGFDAPISVHIEDEVLKLADIEKNKIIERLHFYNGNISKTAEDLGISRPALYRKLEKYHISYL
ncbi:sigma-54-dependent Fis family transcriptional regulator [Flavobacterium sp. xlx-214]|uniref:sigma-54-dependent transcriptional regulator n=1 Tax=unclassified Flavobacterium TaxID=196869 RepID=UPI0013CF87E4|nr:MULTISPECIES: sigma-54 dependent transcriptional regulator [unclassified Flavobacterium]MBA5791764.1 sigma-54-dependent Fis family transcriptional regulator [Flavobacterium sp. xlx-221]QMI83003.1 sigma-54-dependent Fis family transcriptional regulator [Flavobacterium sp. xlx-214]